MGSKGSSSAAQAPAPQPPNAGSVIAQQSQANVNSAIAQGMLNNTNQYGPYGSVTYDIIGTNKVGDGNGGLIDVPKYQANVNLSPEQRRLYDTQTQIAQGTSDLGNAYVSRIRDATATPFNYDGLPTAPTYDEQFRQQRLDTILQRAQPQMDRARSAYEQRLADQGIGIGDEAYKTGWDQFERGQNDFRLGADLQSMTEAERAYALAANTRDRAIQERANLRTQPINEVAALLGTGPGVQNPNFVNTPQVQVGPTDVSGIYGNNFAGQMSGYNSQMQQQQAAAAQGAQSQQGMQSGLFGLGSAAIIGGATMI